MDVAMVPPIPHAKTMPTNTPNAFKQVPELFLSVAGLVSGAPGWSPCLVCFCWLFVCVSLVLAVVSSPGL